MKKKNSNMVTVQGYIDPVIWDEEEEISAVDIVADDSRRYRVEHTGSGTQLLEYVDEYVSATGTVSKRQGQLTIDVHRFEITDAPSIDETEEDW